MQTQTSDAPDLAHTHARPVHWLTTATVMAAVIAGAGLLQPGHATATTPAPHAAPAPDPAAAAFPLECAGAGTTVYKQAAGDLDGDGNPETVAAVRCASGSGTPPSGVYVLTRGARVVATLVSPDEALSVADIEVRDGVVSGNLLGYSSKDVPRCCPDQQRQVNWRWADGKFVRDGGSGTPAAESV
ncbi:hypothetical protein GCM10020367_55890 [Streptomyces sannanensis]|uniref:Secreted protein n=1 Tax=Streptomyces sannanensis TaxID=285536 RepID=A0ABP6SIU9_9ACTN